MRTHVILSEELLAGVDTLVGKRKRSRFVEDAVREKLERERLGEALRATAGILSEEDYPYWSSPEKVAEWVRRSRAEDDLRLRTLSEDQKDG